MAAAVRHRGDPPAWLVVGGGGLMALALARALMAALMAPVNVGLAMQQAFDEGKRLDLFDIQCQSCAGFGVVANLADRWYQGDEMVYGGKLCPECDGLGSPRM